MSSRSSGSDLSSHPSSDSFIENGTANESIGTLGIRRVNPEERTAGAVLQKNRPHEYRHRCLENSFFHFPAPAKRKVNVRYHLLMNGGCFM